MCLWGQPRGALGEALQETQPSGATCTPGTLSLKPWSKEGSALSAEGCERSGALGGLWVGSAVVPASILWSPKGILKLNPRLSLKHGVWGVGPVTDLLPRALLLVYGMCAWERALFLTAVVGQPAKGIWGRAALCNSFQERFSST